MSELTEAHAVATVKVEVRLPRGWLGSSSLDEVRIAATKEALLALREKFNNDERFSIREVSVSAVITEAIRR